MSEASSFHSPAPRRRDRSRAGRAAADEPPRRNGARAPELPPPVALERAAALRLLRVGDLEIVGRLVDASNATLVCRLSGEAGPGVGEVTTRCVYKPVRGEAPLSDFPDGTLANREVAAHAVSEATGWEIVPPTVLRDGPFGRGMVQLWVEVDPEVDLLELVRSPHPALRRMALFDAIINNADRKGGHLLPVPGGHVHGVDHGVCFAVEPKLRTILWGWRGAALADEECATLGRLRAGFESDLGPRLADLLSEAEVEATRRRIDGLLATRRFPQPDPFRPAIPWPPF